MRSLYVHIPFCAARCPYCDFFVHFASHLIEPFFSALSRETASRSGELQGESIAAIHFGGGTPSMVPVRYLAAWLEQVAGIASFAPDIEITVEANPEDLSLAKLDELHAAGITRISLGVQSFVREKLQRLGRHHGVSEAVTVVEAALQRFHSVSLDLICGVPGETLPDWQQDLARAMQTCPHHLSVYMLSIEPGTRFARAQANGAMMPPDDGLLADCYSWAMEELPRHGFRQYEVSNFALPGHHSRYNLACWQRKPYHGFGPAAHSFLVEGEREFRRANIARLGLYLAQPTKASLSIEELSDRERFVEQVLLTLRINTGLDIGFLLKEHKFRPNLQEAIGRFEHRGWLEHKHGVLYLTAKGYLFADLIAEAFISY